MTHANERDETMKTMRAGNTATEMKNSGEWMAVGRKHYRHIDGAEIKYDHNAWGWRINDGKEVWTRLWVAKHNAEKGLYC